MKISPPMIPSTPYSVDPSLAARALQVGREVAALFSLPAARAPRRGAIGPRQFAVAGSSVELFDHREYHPGDEIRHIDWRVTARGQRPVIRLFEQETAPRVEILLDASASMRITAEKWGRALECVAFLLEAAHAENASPRLFLNKSGRVHELRREDFRNGWQGESDNPFPGPPIPWSASGLRFVVSDLLFAGAPGGYVKAWRANGPLVVVAPRTEAEENPPWDTLDLVEDCERGEHRELRHSLSTRSAYRRAYETHFANWREALQARSGVLVAIPAEKSLTNALARPDSPFALR